MRGDLPRSTYVPTLIPAGADGNWGTKAIDLAISFRPTAFVERPPIITSPSNPITPAIARRALVFPEPFGPTSASHPRFGTDKESSRRTTDVP